MLIAFAIVAPAIPPQQRDPALPDQEGLNRLGRELRPVREHVEEPGAHDRADQRPQHDRADRTLLDTARHGDPAEQPGADHEADRDEEAVGRDREGVADAEAIEDGPADGAQHRDRHQGGEPSSGPRLRPAARPQARDGAADQQPAGHVARVVHAEVHPRGRPPRGRAPVSAPRRGGTDAELARRPHGVKVVSTAGMADDGHDIPTGRAISWRVPSGSASSGRGRSTTPLQRLPGAPTSPRRRRAPAWPRRRARARTRASAAAPAAYIEPSSVTRTKTRSACGPCPAFTSANRPASTRRRRGTMHDRVPIAQRPRRARRPTPPGRHPGRASCDERPGGVTSPAAGQAPDGLDLALLRRRGRDAARLGAAERVQALRAERAERPFEPVLDLVTQQAAVERQRRRLTSSRVASSRPLRRSTARHGGSHSRTST